MSGALPSVLDDFKGGGLLSFDAVGVDRVDDGEVSGLADLAHKPEGIVEIAADGDNLRPINKGLRHFAGRDFARRAAAPHVIPARAA